MSECFSGRSQIMHFVRKQKQLIRSRRKSARRHDLRADLWGFITIVTVIAITCTPTAPPRIPKVYRGQDETGHPACWFCLYCLTTLRQCHTHPNLGPRWKDVDQFGVSSTIRYHVFRIEYQLSIKYYTIPVTILDHILFVTQYNIHRIVIRRRHLENPSGEWSIKRFCWDCESAVCHYKHSQTIWRLPKLQVSQNGGLYLKILEKMMI
jgi:hypothetical protein